MAKALKIAAVVVGAVALTVATAGVGTALAAGASLGTALGAAAGTTLFVGSAYASAAALALIAGGLSVASSLLTKAPTVPTSQSERLVASVNPRAFRTEALGLTALATDIRYEEWSGVDQDYCDWIVALASHAIDGVEEVWLDTEMAWSATTGVVGKFAGYFWVEVVPEGGPGVGPAFGQWGEAARLTGCAYARLRFKITGNSKKAESPFSSGPTTRITIIGRGRKLYDPRRDSTVPGGSGPMRADDQSTWRYTAVDGAVIGENIALQILGRLLGWRITNPVTGEKRLATGSGLPARRIDLASFIVAANLCDEQVNRSAGGTEPRYHAAGVVSEGDDPKTILDALCAACCGRFRDTGGKLSLVIAHNDLAEAVADEGLTTDDVIGGFTWDPDPALEATPNVVRGRYVDATAEGLYQLVDYPEVRVASVDGIDRIFPLNLGMVESASQAQRIASQVLQRKQYARRFSAPFDIRAWGWPVGKVVPFTFAPLGFVRQLFRVVEQEIGPGGSCQMTLEGESADIYAWDADDVAPVQAVGAIGYDPRRDPLVQAVADAEAATLQAAIATSFPIGLAISVTDAGEITISAHTRRYTDGHGDVAVAGGTIASGLAAGDFRAIGYDDVSRAGGSVAYQLYADDIDARASPAHPGRHYVGYIVVPTAGSPPSDGGGATPPGGQCVTVDTPVLLADGTTKAAGELAVGDMLLTRHEYRLGTVCGGWGYYPIEAITIADSDDVWQATIGGKVLRATREHLVWTGDWVAISDVVGAAPLAGTFPIVKLTVTSAHTYVSNGVLSHNIKPVSDL